MIECLLEYFGDVLDRVAFVIIVPVGLICV